MSKTLVVTLLFGCLFFGLPSAAEAATRWQGCSSSNDCSEEDTFFCHVGDRRCLRMDDCEWANQVDHTSRDCTPMAGSRKMDAERSNECAMKYTYLIVIHVIAYIKLIVVGQKVICKGMNDKGACLWDCCQFRFTHDDVKRILKDGWGAAKKARKLRFIQVCIPQCSS